MTSKYPPKHVVIVGAGIVGLSIAWFLQDYGVQVTIFDRKGVAAGSSWGNAGWISPGLTTPLPEPSILRYGLKSLVQADAPLYIPFSVDRSLVKFLFGFARKCTEREWYRSMRAYIALNNEAYDAYDVLRASDSALEVHEAPIMAAFRHRDEAKDLIKELEMINRAGQIVHTEVLSGHELRQSLPQLSDEVEFGVRIDGQRYIDPGSFVTKLGVSVARRGGTFVTNTEVDSLQSTGDSFSVGSKDGKRITADAVVLANGAWISKLAGPLGVKTPVQAGRGYSFSVQTREKVDFPIYFPAVRVACTPLSNDSLRIAGTMEFRKPDFRIDPARISAIVRSASPLLDGVDWSQRRDEWVGPRPVSADGLPLIGESKIPGVFIAGGHGMWGITLGPVTGRLLASQIVKGEIPNQLRPFSPVR